MANIIMFNKQVNGTKDMYIINIVKKKEDRADSELLKNQGN